MAGFGGNHTILDGDAAGTINPRRRVLSRIILARKNVSITKHNQRPFTTLGVAVWYLFCPSGNGTVMIARSQR